MIAEICLKVLDGFGMPAEWALGIVVISTRGRVILGTAATIDTIAMKLLEHGMKVVECQLNGL